MSEDRWIPVDERLPKDCEDVLVFQRTQTGVCVIHTGYWRGDKYGWWFDGCEQHCVTHWMPLPEPPAAGKEGETV